MSTTTKKTSMKGVRYTDAQKKEVVDFAQSYNASNGRGGQSKAAEKFNISPLTVAAWLKGSGSSSSPKAAKAPNGSKPAKAAKAAKATKVAAKSRLGSRYSDEQKKNVTDFVVAYNTANGRGGASTASKKFGVSPLTVMAWLKAAGVNGVNKKTGSKSKAVAKSAKVTKAASGSGDLSAKLNSLLSLSKQIAAAESELANLQSKFNSLKASL
jgi:transposase